MIRFAEEHDFEGIMNLLRQLNPDDPVINDGRDKVIFERILKETNLRILILEENGKIIPTCYLNIIPNLTILARICALGFIVAFYPETNIATHK